MNPTAQLDFHPDADSLNAFVEQALPEPERAQILDHIAACSRCRQVIYLAQEVAAEMKAPPKAQAARSETQPRAWFKNWRLAWVPAAAFAAIVALMVAHHFRPTAPQVELARLAPQDERTVPKAQVQPPADSGATQASPVHQKSSAGNTTPAAPRTPPQEPAPSAVLPADTGTIKLARAETEAIPLPPGAAEQGLALPQTPAQFNPEQAAAAWEPQRQRAVDALSSRSAAAKVTPATVCIIASH